MFKKQVFDNSGIYCYEVQDKTTSRVQKFYDVEPFPNYENDEDKQSIINKGNKNIFSKKLKNFIGYNKSFIEIGSGTSQLSNYLAIGTNNRVVAFDPTLKSLKLGYEFSKKNNVKNITYVNADIFDDVLSDNYFDFVWCSGVLHHTKDPYQGFKIIIKSLKTNGYVFIGLYNSYGRFRTFIRQYLYKIFGKRLIMILDPYLRSLNLKYSERKINSWIRDQYEHPVETSLTFDDVLTWFDHNNIKFVSSIPSIGGQLNEISFQTNNVGRGSYLLRLFTQIGMIFSRLGGEGGLFVMIGKKR